MWPEPGFWMMRGRGTNERQSIKLSSAAVCQSPRKGTNERKITKPKELVQWPYEDNIFTQIQFMTGFPLAVTYSVVLTNNDRYLPLVIALPYESPVLHTFPW